MSIERKQRMFEVLDAALERSAEERAAFLDAECGEDTPLRQEVEALLDTEIDGGPLAEPAFSIHAEDAGVGRRIGPYHLVRLLDRGGMGTVYLAEREDFEQRVALKLIRRGLDADELLVRRFENERQILARLQHPHIAHLLDGGTTEDRLPYFVMEYVEGVPIDRYCRDRELPVDARLKLFRKVCAAVQFAHQNLVIHRDLKPGNILIAADGEPKLLDFGIAKLLDDSLTASPVETELGQGPMTPRYASPEQIRLQPVTTASDVYSLGVLLYELLTGLDPYDVRGRRGDQVARAVCDQEPERPSTAVRRRAAEPEADSTRKLRRRLAGDLDSIVLKAMRKEPRERYASAEQLSDDLRRHLDGLPVDAQTGSFRYRAGKFVRRHRLGMGVAAAFLMLILGFSLASTVLWRQADRERQISEATLDTLETFIAAADPDETGGGDLTVVEALRRGREKALEELESEDPELRMNVAGTLGEMFYKQGLHEAAVEMMELALSASRTLYQGDNAEVAKRLSNLGVVRLATEDYHRAEKAFRDALTMRLNLGQEGQELFRVKNNLGATLLCQGKLEEAARLRKEVLEGRLSQYKDGQSDTDVASSRHNLAAVYYAQGYFDKAEDLVSQALKTRRDRLGSPNTRVAASMDLLADVLAAQGRNEEAGQFYRGALDMRLNQLRLGENHRDVAKTRKDLAALLARKDPEEALELAQKAFVVFDELRSDGWDAAETKSVQGMILIVMGEFEAAESLLIEGYEQMKNLRGDTTYRSRLARDRILELSEALGRPEHLEGYRVPRPDDET